MSDYSQVTIFTTKDSLSSGDPEKIILGADVDGEFSAISTAIATKYDSTDVASQAEAEALTSNAKLITPQRLNDVLVDNGGMLGDIQALADPNADTVLGWDDSAGAVIGWTVGTGLGTTAGGALEMSHLGFEDLSDPNADRLVYWDDSAGALNWLTIDNGITVDADDTMGLTDVSAAAGQPVAISSGTFSFDMSSLATLTIETLSQTQDSILVSDNGTLKLLPVDNVGSKIAASSTKDIDGDDDVNQIYVNTGGSDHTMTIAPESTYDFPVGTEVGFLCESTGNITLVAGSGVTINSLNSYLVVKPSGGGGYIVKTGTNIWTLVGDLQA